MKTNAGVISAAWAMFAIVAITFCAELLTTVALLYFGYVSDSIGIILTDAAMLAILIAPPIYWLVATPLRREYEKRLYAESRAAELGQLAITDPLTRTRNRRGITIGVLEAMAHAERYQHPLSVAMVDVDHFKEVNDKYGHKAGDRVLEGVASILVETLRMPDKVGRYGGEEFLLILAETGLEQTTTIVERIRAEVGAAEFDIGNDKIKLTISIGATPFVKGEDLEQLLSRADRALYEAKRSGRNLVVTTEGE